MEAHPVQLQFFQYLKENLPPHLSMVEELCELLSLSHDSVYRRIRGEKPMTFSELKQICEHYHFSIDQVLQLQNSSVIFQAPELNNNGHRRFSDYLQGVLKQCKYFNSFTNRKMFYFCKDANLWYFYLFPELAAFKTFFWAKTIQNHPDFIDQTFSLERHSSEENFGLGQLIIKEYNEMESVELWNIESMSSTIHQIEYYRDAGLFHRPEDFDLVVKAILKMLDHLQAQALKGRKFLPGGSETSYRASSLFYVNELILGNNDILLELDGQRIAIITYNVLNYLITRDERFTEKAFRNFDTLLSRATLISGTGEKDRNKFFNGLRERARSMKA
jgi:hypothetical protein